MAKFKSQQQHLTIRGRSFHFVSYEGRPANLQRAQLAFPAMWYLMVEGHRCPVFPFDRDQSHPELEAALRDWAEDNAAGPAPGAPQSLPPALADDLRKTRHWWGAN